MPRGHRILNSVACVNHGTSSLSAQPPVFASPFLLSLSSLLQANDLPSPPPNVVPDLLGDNVRQSASTLPTPFASGRASSLAPRVQVTAAFALGPIGNPVSRCRTQSPLVSSAPPSWPPALSFSSDLFGCQWFLGLGTGDVALVSGLYSRFSTNRDLDAVRSIPSTTSLSRWGCKPFT